MPQETPEGIGATLARIEKSRAAPAAPPKKRIGVADDPLEDFGNLVGEIRDFFVWVPSQVIEHVKHPDEYIKDWKYLFQPGVMGEAGSLLLDAALETHKNDRGQIDILESATRRPFHFIADALMVKGIVTKAARVAGVAKAARFAPILEALERFPAAQAKAGLVKLGETAPVKAVREAMGFGPETRDIMRIRAHEYASEAITEAESLAKLAAQKLSPDEAASLRRAIRVGAPEDLARLGPNARKWYDSFTNLVRGQESFILEKDLLTERRMLVANAKAAALELYGNASTANTRAAVKLIQEGKIKPTYASLFREKEATADLFNTLNQDIRRITGKYGRLEERTARGLYDPDIVATAVKQVKAFHAMKARVRFLDRTLAHLATKGLARPIRRLDDLRPGEAALQAPLLKRYLEAEMRAASLFWRARMGGASGQEAVRAAFAQTLADPAFRTVGAELNHVAVPRHVAALVARELAIPGPIGRVYDRVMGYWKGLATVFRPQYWLSVAVGNGIMSAMAGVGPEDVARLRHFKHLLPPEVRSRLQHDLAVPGTNAYERVAGTLGEYSSVLDRTLLRQPVFSTEVEAIRRRLLSAGGSAFVAIETLDDPAKFAQLVAAAPDKISEAERLMVLLRERAAARVPEYRKMRAEYEKTVRQATKLEAEYTGRLTQELGGVTPAREGQLRAKLAALAREAAELEAGKIPMAKEAVMLQRQLRKGKASVARELERVLRQQETASVADLRAVLTDIRKRGGIGPAGLTEEWRTSIPRGLRGTKGVPWDELAQELADRGVISGASFNELADYLGRAVEAIRGSKEAIAGVKAKARRLAAGQIRDALGRLVRNAGEQTGIRHALAQIAKKRREAKTTLEAVSAEGRARMTAMEEGLTRLQERATRLEARLKQAEAEIVEGLDEAGVIERRLPEMRAIAGWADEAIVAGNRLAGDMMRMHPVERVYLRRSVPFYTYTKAMTLFVAKLPFVHPGKVFLWNRWAHLVADMRQDDDFPEWLKDYVPVGHTQDGSTVYIRLSTMLPWGGIRTAEIGQVPVPSLLDVASQNPAVKVLFELRGGPTWTKRPWSTTETMTRLDNGEVYEWRDGRARKTIAQPSLWRSLWYLLPHAQLVEEVLFPYVMTDRGWVGHPEAIMDPSGRVMYPRGLLESVASIVSPRMVVRQEEDLRRQERARTMSFVRSYIKDLKRAAPEKREAMREVLDDVLESLRTPK